MFRLIYLLLILSMPVVGQEPTDSPTEVEETEPAAPEPPEATQEAPSPAVVANEIARGDLVQQTRMADSTVVLLWIAGFQLILSIVAIILLVMNWLAAKAAVNHTGESNFIMKEQIRATLHPEKEFNIQKIDNDRQEMTLRFKWQNQGATTAKNVYFGIAVEFREPGEEMPELNMKDNGKDYPKTVVSNSEVEFDLLPLLPYTLPENINEKEICIYVRAAAFYSDVFGRNFMDVRTMLCVVGPEDFEDSDGYDIDGGMMEFAYIGDLNGDYHIS